MEIRKYLVKVKNPDVVQHGGTADSVAASQLQGLWQKRFRS